MNVMIPDFQSVMLALLQFAAASPNSERSTREPVDFLVSVSATYEIKRIDSDYFAEQI